MLANLLESACYEDALVSSVSFMVKFFVWNAELLELIVVTCISLRAMIHNLFWALDLFLNQK